MNSGLRARLSYLVLLVAVVGLDQLTKQLIARFIDLHDSRAVIEGCLSLTHVRNRGAAFGILSNADIPYQAVVFSTVSLAALLAIAIYAWRLPAQNRLPQVALALIMGGAVGNLLDRIVHGYVIDFIDAFWGTRHWWTFNAADSAITIGVSLLVLDILWDPKASKSTGSDMARATSLGRTE